MERKMIRSLELDTRLFVNGTSYTLNQFALNVQSVDKDNNRANITTDVFDFDSLRKLFLKYNMTVLGNVSSGDAIKGFRANGDVSVVDGNIVIAFYLDGVGNKFNTITLAIVNNKITFNWVGSSVDPSSITVVEEEGTSDTSVMSQNGVTLALGKRDAEILATKNIANDVVIGKNKLNPYYSYSGSKELYKGGIDTVIGTGGVVSQSSNWYTCEPISWSSLPSGKCAVKNLRRAIQYDSNGNIIVSTYVDANNVDTVVIKDSNASFVKLSVLNANKSILYAYDGDTFGVLESYVRLVTSTNGIATNFKPIVDYSSRVKTMLLSDSFTPVNPTYTDGVINSPVSILWGDNATGVLTLTRSEGIVSAISGTYVSQDAGNRSFTMTISRDSNLNISSVTYNFI